MTPVFRTVLTPPADRQHITHDNKIVMLGSCFTDSVGALLLKDGFSVSVNPMGVLYNPISISRVIKRALERRLYTLADLTVDEAGVWHCLDFESRRQSTDAETLLESLNGDFITFADALSDADTWIITFGTAWVFERTDGGGTVGNCHKFKPSFFQRRRLSVEEVVNAWLPFLNDRRIIFTVSPIRHTADGLHGNQLSKSTLLLATEQLGEYFPSYEALMDDLRDYRFYAADMKHPSDVAVEYIYSLFTQTYFSEKTTTRALQCRRQWLRSQHRPIL